MASLLQFLSSLAVAGLISWGIPRLPSLRLLAWYAGNISLFTLVYYLAAYGTIPIELYEAASIDGATRSQYFWQISLPMLRHTIISGATISIIGALKYFDLVFVMTGGGPGVSTELMATLMYKTSFVKFNMGYGATVACSMFLLITIVALLTISTLNKKRDF
jgi:raffinose/stachyose/melibiose transport system permease protein